MTKQFDDVYVVSGPVFIPNQTQEPDPNDKRQRTKKFLRYLKKKFIFIIFNIFCIFFIIHYLSIFLIDTRYEVLGDSEVAVPTHLFKVILVYPKNESKNNSTQGKEKEKEKDKERQQPLVAAFLVPNDRIPSNKELTDYQVPLEHLEKYTGEQKINI